VIIDPAKVMVVYNSYANNISGVDAGEAAGFSQRMAEWYVSSDGRNLPGAHLYPFNFGSTGSNYNNPDILTDLVEPIGRYQWDNGIEFILMAPGTPHIAKDTGTQGKNISLSNLLGHAKFHTKLGKLPNYYGPEWENTHAPQGEIAYRPHNTLSFYPDPDKDWQWGSFIDDPNVSESGYGRQWEHQLQGYIHRSSRIPFGRLGLPHVYANSSYETEVEFKRMVTDALASETTFADAIAGNKFIHLGAYHRTGTLHCVRAYWAQQKLIAAGFGDITKMYKRSWDLAFSTYPEPTWDYLWTDIENATYGNPQINAWGLVGTAITQAGYFPPGTDSCWPNYYTFLQGAWGYEATSSGYYMMCNLLERGGCCAMGSATEPFDNGIIATEGLIQGVINGVPMCVAMLEAFCIGSWQMECCGDPLYAPFGGEEPVDYMHITDQPRFIKPRGVAGNANTIRSVQGAYNARGAV